jgi:hypothetical protein
MKTEKEIQEEIEKTLRSFDGDRVLEANPFLLTQMKAKREDRSLGRNRGLAVHLNLRYAALALLISLNLFTALYYYEWNTKHNLQEQLVSELKEDLQVDQSQNIF